MKRDFTFWLPIIKSSSDPDGYAVEGVASTDDVDLQGERVDQRGIDCEPLLKSGFINWNHGSSPKDIIGYPIKAEIVRSEEIPALRDMGVTGQALWLKGQLLRGNPTAEEVRALIKSLEGTPRQLGFSIQGRIQSKHGDDILRCELHQIALTHEPVNPMTFAQVAKSFASLSSSSAPIVSIKAMTTGSASPLLLEDLGLAHSLANRLYGECPKWHFNDRGAFKSTRDAFEHLITCKGEPVESASRFLKALVKAGFDRELRSFFQRSMKHLRKNGESSSLRSHLNNNYFGPMNQMVA
jgi:hypothetical protein